MSRREARTQPARKASAGRPRAMPGSETGNARNDIVIAASKLFRDRGYAGTSIQAIATEAGLRKASIYYYFSRKEDILAAMIEDVMRPPLALIKRLDGTDLSPGACLYQFLSFDVRQLCEAAYDYSWFLTMIETRSDRFAGFWADRKRLLKWIEAKIEEGAEIGQFIDVDPERAAHMIFASDEFAVTWFGRPSSGAVGDIGEFVAGLAVRSILKRPQDLQAIRAEA